MNLINDLFTRYGTPVVFVKYSEAHGWVWVRYDDGEQREYHLSELKGADVDELIANLTTNEEK